MVEFIDLGQRFRDGVWANVQAVEPPSDGPSLEMIDARTLVNSNYTQSWFVDDIFVRNQPAILGGGKKTLKTNMLVDLSVSIATGLPFLGRFRVEEPMRVGMISGESGEGTIQETFRRVCVAKEIAQPADVPVFFGFRMPRLSMIDDLDRLAAEITEHNLQVVILDPLYLGLLAGNHDVQASNLYQIGPLLANVSRTCLDAGATPILAHHTKKNLISPNTPPELEDLAFAGVQEFARQWILVSRREKFVPGAGEPHRLWLNVGGSAGHNSSWAVDIDEGQLRHDFTGRTWVVSVQTAGQAQHDAIESRQQAGQQARQETQQRREQEHRDRVVEFLAQCPDGETANVIARACRLSSGRVLLPIMTLSSAGVIEPVQVMKPAGRGMRAYSGFRLAPDQEGGAVEDGDDGRGGENDSQNEE